MSRRLYSYRHGEPVWARVDGHPWWPGRVVTPEEVICDEGEPRPTVKVGELLIEFFDETNSFAPLKVRHVRPFLNKRRTNNQRQIEGKIDRSLKQAISRAQKYVKEKNWTPAEPVKRKSPAPSVPLATLQYTPARPDPSTEAGKPQSKTAQSPAQTENRSSRAERRTKRSRQAAMRAEPEMQPSKRKRQRTDRTPEPAPDVTHAVIVEPRKGKKRKRTAVNETDTGTLVKKISAEANQAVDVDVQHRQEISAPRKRALEVARGKRGRAHGGQNASTDPALEHLASEDHLADNQDDSVVPSKGHLANHENDSVVPSKRKKRTATETHESSVVEQGETVTSLKKEMASLLRDRDDMIADLQVRIEKLERNDLIITGQELISTGQELVRTGQTLVQACRPVLESVGSLLQGAAPSEGSNANGQPCSGFFFMARK